MTSASGVERGEKKHPPRSCSGSSRGSRPLPSTPKAQATSRTNSSPPSAVCICPSRSRRSRMSPVSPADATNRMIHAPVIVAVPRAARLFPVDLDRQAVDVDDQRLRTPPPAHRLQPPPRQPLQPLAQHLDALLRRPRRHPPRQRRLRGQAPGLAQRSRARPVAGGQPQRRIVPQLRGVAVLPAALPRQQQKRPRQPLLRMPDPAFVPLVRQPLRQKPHHPAAPQQLAPRQSPRIPRDPVPAGPDPDRPVEAERR